MPSGTPHLRCFGAESPLEPAACTPPQVVRSDVSPNANNVLSAIVSAEVLTADSIAVRFGAPATAALDSVTAVVPPETGATRVPVLGLHPDTGYALQVVAFNDCAAAEGEVLRFTTAELPSDLAYYVAGGPAPSPGYVVFAAGSYGLVIDNSGRVVWYHRFPNGPGLNFQAQANGRYVARPTASAPGQTANWLEFDPLGMPRERLRARAGWCRGYTM